MTEPPSSPENSDAAKPVKTVKRSLLDRVFSLVRREPEDREGIKTLLDSAYERELLDAESYTIIKGALAFSERTVGEIMVPRPRMDLLDGSQPLPQLLPAIIDTAHSRFPVYEGDRDNIIGILLAKDLLRCMLEPGVELRALLRPAMYVPETKRLDALLRDFRSVRNHLAVVIDEHGGISGLITMEDVLEQIVGDIEDEFDDDEEETIFADGDDAWRVMARTEIEHFNDALHTDLPTHEYDSVGGWLSGELGRIPRRGDAATHGDLHVEVARADARRALWLRVKRVPAPAEPATQQ